MNNFDCKDMLKHDIIPASVVSDIIGINSRGVEEGGAFSDLHLGIMSTFVNIKYVHCVCGYC